MPWRSQQDTTRHLGQSKDFTFHLSTHKVVMGSTHKPGNARAKVVCAALTCSLCLQFLIQSLWHDHTLICSRTGTSFSAQDRWHSITEHWAGILCHCYLWARGFNARMPQSSKTHLGSAIHFLIGFFLLYYSNWVLNAQSLIYFHSLCGVKGKYY